MSELTLRPATAADLSSLSALAVRAFVTKFGHLYSQTNLDAFLAGSLSETAFAADLNDPTRLIQLAERDGALLAFVKIAVVCGFPEYARGAVRWSSSSSIPRPRRSAVGLARP